MRRSTATFARLVPLGLPFALYILGALVGLGVSFDLSLSLGWVSWLCFGGLAYALIVGFGRTPQRLAGMAALPIGLATLGALVLALQYRHMGYDVKFGVIDALGRLTSAVMPGVLGWPIDRNALASLMLSTLPLSVGLAISLSGRQRIVWGACAGVLALGLALTASRGAWIGLGVSIALVGLAVWVGQHQQRLFWRRAWPLSESRTWQAWLGQYWPILALAGVVMAALILGLVLAFTGSGQRVVDALLLRADDRLGLYRNSFFLALDAFYTGIGPGKTFPWMYASFALLIGSEYLGYAHNLFLGAWLSQGLLGLAGLLALMLGAARLFWQGLIQSRGVMWPVGIGGMIGCTAIVLHGLTDAPQYDANWAGLLLVHCAVFGLTVALARVGDPRPLEWMRLSRPAWVGTGVVLLASLIMAGPTLVALAHVNMATALQESAHLAPDLDADRKTYYRLAAEIWADRALAIQPELGVAEKRRGMLAFNASDYDRAVELLQRAHAHQPADQSVRKALGYSLIWAGNEQAGAEMLATLDHLDWIRAELDIWPRVWSERGRADLAQRTLVAARLFNQVMAGQERQQPSVEN